MRGGYWTYVRNVWVADRRRAWTFDPVSITGPKKTITPADHGANGKQWRVTMVGFPLKGNVVFLRISLRNPLLLMETMEPSKQGLCNSAAWFQLKHWISKTITPILMCIFYVFPVYFDGKFVGGALAYWYGKLAPVVDQCFESQKHWIFAFFSSETASNFIPKNNLRLHLTPRLSYTIQTNPWSHGTDPFNHGLILISWQ